jgi:hypothetical protein
MIQSVRFNIILALSIQLSKSASLRRGGGLVTPGSRVNVVGMNCNINSSVMNTYLLGSDAICRQCTQNPWIITKIYRKKYLTIYVEKLDLVMHVF